MSNSVMKYMFSTLIGTYTAPSQASAKSLASTGISSAQLQGCITQCSEFADGASSAASQECLAECIGNLEPSAALIEYANKTAKKKKYKALASLFGDEWNATQSLNAVDVLTHGFNYHGGKVIGCCFQWPDLRFMQVGFF